MATSIFFVMIKPDGIKRRLVGKIISRFERKGFELINMKMHLPSKQIIEQHYLEHADKSFYEELIEFTTSGPVIPMLWKGNIEVARQIVGKTVPWDARKGTIRGDFACCLPQNLVHCSDTVESAKNETELWFGNSL